MSKPVSTRSDGCEKVLILQRHSHLFDSGQADLKPEGEAILRKVAEVLAQQPDVKIHVIGHTDNVPTSASGPFPSNWELSAARALAVVHSLQDGGVDPTRISAAGYAEFQPIAGNETPEGRSLNRRIEIVLVPLEGAVAAPEAPKPAAPPAKAKL